MVENFKENGINAWLDVKEVSGGSNLFGEITKGLNLAKLVVACFSDEYVESQNCILEFKFAHVSLKIPIIKVIVGKGNEWRRHELAFLSGIYPEFNLQTENNGKIYIYLIYINNIVLFNFYFLDAYFNLLNTVKTELAKIEQTKVKENNNQENEENINDNDNTTAFQELYELTQRKFLTQLTKFCNTMHTVKEYPRLFSIDLIEKHKIDALDQIRNTSNVISNKNNEDNNTEPIVRRSLIKQKTIQTEFIQCIRPLCEHDEGWHFTDSFVPLDTLNTEFCSYLARIMNILKNGSISNNNNIYITENGINLLKEIELKASSDEKEVYQSYISLRNFFIEKCDIDFIYTFETFNSNELDSKKKFNLERCELKNHKIVWLCKNHIEKLNAKILTDSTKTNNSSGLNNESYDILNEITKIEFNKLSF